MARSRALDVYRDGGARDRLELVVDQDEPRVEDRPPAAAERRDERQAVLDALRTLPGAQREALVPAYWGGLTADEIARRVGVRLGTAKSRIRLGIAKLRSELTDAVAKPELAPAA